MNKILIIANWKMNPQTLEEAKRLFKAVALKVKSQKLKVRNYEIIICPPFPYLSLVNRLTDSLIRLGSQNVFWEQKGAFTGEISPKILKDLGCKYVIIGHSERRKYLKETDSVINKKLLAAAKAGLNMIFCIGEKEGQDPLGILKKQLQRGLEKFPPDKVRLLNIAYEPVWAIGTGKPCLSENALVAKALIRKVLASIFKRSVAQKIRILYGGSVNRKIAASYIKEAGMDGFILGGASLNAEEFVKIVNSIKG